MGEKIFVVIVGLLFGLMAGAIAVPVVWFLVRIAGLLNFLMSVMASATGTMFLGGLIVGALAGALTLFVAMKILSETNRLAVISGAVGGMVGGFASSVMFFPIVGIL